jgi:hypothetical protein
MTGNVRDMLPMEDQALLQNTLVSLSVEDTVIDQIMSMLQTQETELKNDPLPEVQETWFGGSYTGGYRLAVNAAQASAAVEVVLKDMLIGLQEYRTAIKDFADDVKDTDATIAVSNARIQNAANCTDDTTATTCAAPTENP